MKYKLHLRYVYTFYSFDEILDCDVRDETVEFSDETRFTLYQQEDSSFIISDVRRDCSMCEYAILTYPNKDNVVIKVGDEVELAYDEFFDSMGNNNHNVYEGTVALIKE